MYWLVGWGREQLFITGRWGQAGSSCLLLGGEVGQGAVVYYWEFMQGAILYYWEVRSGREQLFITGSWGQTGSSCYRKQFITGSWGQTGSSYYRKQLFITGSWGQTESSLLQGAEVRQGAVVYYWEVMMDSEQLIIIGEGVLGLNKETGKIYGKKSLTPPANSCKSLISWGGWDWDNDGI